MWSHFINIFRSFETCSCVILYCASFVCRHSSMMQCEFWPLMSQSLVAHRIVKQENSGWHDYNVCIIQELQGGWTPIPVRPQINKLTHNNQGPCRLQIQNLSYSSLSSLHRSKYKSRQTNVKNVILRNIDCFDFLLTFEHFSFYTRESLM